MEKCLSVVITLLKEGFDVDEIQDVLNITPHEFSLVLKQVRELGYNYKKETFSDGKMIIKGTPSLNFNPHKNMKINVLNNRLHTIFTSDFHVGGPFERPKRIETLTEYAVSHDIHTIINTGDIINDYYPDQDPELKIQDPVKQARRVLRYTPYTRDLLFYNLGGNHDYKSLDERSFDSIRYYENARYDMISLGYGQCFIRLENDTIAIAHDLKNTNHNISSTMIFKGHSHKSKNRDNKIILVPALTENYQGPYEFLPLSGFLDVEFIFFDGKITKVELRQIAFAGKDLRLANEESMIIRHDYNERMNRRDQRRLTKQKK